MNPAKRRTVIAGNWKMNFTPAEATAFINEIKPMVAGKDNCDIVFCAPYVTIAAAMEAAKGSNIKIGAENVHFAPKGAYTGEVSADMLRAIGVEYVIVGHSERRQYFAETDETVNLRTKAALAAGMKVILCLGEVKEQRLAGITDEVVGMQTKLDLAGISAEDMKSIIIAYEPVWAIGTGLTATPDQAEETCAVIRRVVAGRQHQPIEEFFHCERFALEKVHRRALAQVLAFDRDLLREFAVLQRDQAGHDLRRTRDAALLRFIARRQHPPAARLHQNERGGGSFRRGSLTGQTA